MDSRKQDESKTPMSEPRRDEALSRRMGPVLDRFTLTDTSSCPDAEVIAAYYERGLAPDETLHWENHFVGCARCRKILTTLTEASAEPLAEADVARLSKLVAPSAPSTQPSPWQKVKPVPPSRWDWRLRWLGPAISAAAVLAIWFAASPPWRSKVLESSGTLIAQAPKSEFKPEVELPSRDRDAEAKVLKKAEASTPPAKDQSAEESTLKTRPAGPAPHAVAKTGAENDSEVDKNRPRAEVANGAIQDEMKEQSKTTAPTDAVPSAPRAQVPAAARAPGTAGAATSTSQSVAVTGEAPAVSSAQAAPSAGGVLGGVTNAPLNGIRGQSLSKLSAGVARGVVPIKSPSGAVLWRIGTAGSILRSIDAGVTWILQDSPSREDWLAGSAASDTVCWVVGRNGAIARTTDGNHWESIVPPPSSVDSLGKFPDWAEVSARDAQNATITDAEQRHYATRDGGKTWHSQ